MKHLITATLCASVLGLAGAVVYQRFAPMKAAESKPAAMPSAPVANQNAETMAPAGGPNGFPVVNQARLRKLASQEDYRGPSYKENYDLPKAVVAEQTKNANGRIPAAAPTPAAHGDSPAKKTKKTKKSPEKKKSE